MFFVDFEKLHMQSSEILKGYTCLLLIASISYKYYLDTHLCCFWLTDSKQTEPE